MTPHRFDSIARRLGTARSRRRLLTATLGGLVGARLGTRPVAIAGICVGKGGDCAAHGDCCANLRCRDGRCRCQKGQTWCNDECCKDCFAPVGHPNQAVCCAPDKLCSRKKGLADDRCCYDDEACPNGRCCSTIGSFGEQPCGGKCCAINACCNNKCCKRGRICARKSMASGFTCVAAIRTCAGDDDCFIDVDGAAEQCIDGVCCGGNRLCDTPQGPICCGAREYCLAGACCDVHEICGVIRLHRVRV